MKAFYFLIFFVPVICHSQIVITSGAEIGGFPGTDVSVLTSGGVTNNSGYDFSSVQLRLVLSGSNQTISGIIKPVEVRFGNGNQTVNGTLETQRLVVNGGGNKVMTGNLTVTQGIAFEAGFLSASPSGKILYTGSGGQLNGASSTSYVSGSFFVNGTGLLTFPVGAAGLGYTPVQIENGSGSEIGIGAVNANPGLTPSSSDPELVYIDNTHYWAISSDNLASFSSRIILPLINALPEELSAVVVGAQETGGAAFNLGSYSASESSVSSLSPFNHTVVTVGGSTSIDISIHDLISPFTVDGINDELYIENIAKFPSNKVTLLDRYGVVIKEWTNFTNFDDPFNPNTDIYNFSRLSPGNYICIVEYGAEGQSRRRKSQMITVLRVK
jgi:hypothetical protein